MNFSSLDLSGLRFNADGLIPAIIQEAADDGKPAAVSGAPGAPEGGPSPAPAGGAGGRVLMMAWMNRAALGATLETGEMHYWSRSRGQLWRKGEQSGHTQRWVDWYADCDGDTLLFVVRQRGGAACHTGHATCFYQARDAAGRPLPVTAEPLFDPAAVYRAAPAAGVAAPAGT